MRPRRWSELDCCLASIVLGPICLLILAGRYVWLTVLAIWDEMQARFHRGRADESKTRIA